MKASPLTQLSKVSWGKEKKRPWSSFRPSDYDLDTDSCGFTLILAPSSALIRVPFELVAETTINAEKDGAEIRSTTNADQTVAH
jgi:hypothetical protein